MSLPCLQLVPRDYPIHRHCFTGGWRETQQWLDAFPNLCLGLAPLVAFEHVSGDPLIEAARNIPLTRLLLGTDSPYFLPKWLVPRDYPIHRHCFTGGWRETQQWLDAFPNLCLGLAPLVAFEHVSGDPLIEAARNIPLARLLLGTDSPYFLPKWLVPGDYPIHRHCFTGGWRETQQWLDAFPNLCLGLAPLVAFEHVSGDPLIEAARNIPLARLLLGTDSPYFLPKWSPAVAEESAGPDALPRAELRGKPPPTTASFVIASLDCVNMLLSAVKCSVCGDSVTFRTGERAYGLP
ncbi:hypothetical protein HPB48_015170 [Haemaphysalis longicornis]|uniref:Uncharacterized protein n=1 Tax=Haemaphysalis longicornis TaxID=44386 RepID=A0A9J6FIW5_HAELO|nr:hypothetical protein HPB48_015170 [Haemaphysalis longicornis]